MAVEDGLLSQNVLSEEVFRGLIEWLEIVIPTFLAFIFGIVGLIAYKRWEPSAANNRNTGYCCYKKISPKR